MYFVRENGIKNWSGRSCSFSDPIRYWYRVEKWNRKNCSFLHSGEGGELVIAIVPLQHVQGGILVANNDPLQIGIVAEQAVRQRVPQSL